MKKYDFDKKLDRKGTNSYKYDRLEAIFGSADLISLWVADMDFETPSFITDALIKRLNHSVFGYTIEPDSYWRSILDWQKKRHGWEIKREWLTYIPGIVKGIGLSINSFTSPCDKVIIQPPVYHPFRIVPEANGREIVNNPLILENGSYRMDFDHLESVIDEKCKLLILCNPHNPGGIIWDRETLVQLAEVCFKHNILVISDEIHADMGLFGHRHIPFATVSDKAAQISITFGAPSKTFNIAGIVSSFAIVPNDTIRRKFYHWLQANELNHATFFATIATEAAYTFGNEWLDQMLSYLEESILYIEDFLRTHIPQIKPIRPQASFLVWLDCRELGLNHDQLVDLFVRKAGLALNDGEMFGPGGEGFMRMNIGTRKNEIEKALNQLWEAVDGIR